MSTEIEWTLTEEAIEWTMTWDQLKYPDRPPTEQIFEEEKALAHLLMNEVIFTNSRWHEKDLSKELQESIVVFVNCNDVFAWGCSDAEDLPHKEIQPLYRMWRKDPEWGAAIWCIQRRNQMPQRPVAEAIRKAGVWDLDSMGLKENGYDVACRRHL